MTTPFHPPLLQLVDTHDITRRPIITKRVTGWAMAIAGHPAPLDVVLELSILTRIEFIEWRATGMSVTEPQHAVLTPNGYLALLEYRADDNIQRMAEGFTRLMDAIRNDPVCDSCPHDDESDQS